VNSKNSRSTLGLRLSRSALRILKERGILARSTVSLEEPRRAKRYVVHGLESGRVAGDIGHDVSFARADGRLVTMTSAHASAPEIGKVISSPAIEKRVDFFVEKAAVGALRQPGMIMIGWRVDIAKWLRFPKSLTSIDPQHPRLSEQKISSLLLRFRQSQASLN
jgi:hypothetical protein